MDADLVTGRAMPRPFRLRLRRLGLATLLAFPFLSCEGPSSLPPIFVLTIIHDAQPDDAQDFSFTTTGSAPLAPFTLDDDTDPTLQASQTFLLTPGSSYGINEVAVAGWSLPIISCVQTGGTGATFTYTSLGVSVSNATGGTVTCTFSNSKPKPSSITIVKDAQPNDAQDFTFTSSLAGFAPFPLDDDSDAALSNQRLFSNLAAGVYTFTETQVAGWSLSSISCTPGLGTTTNTATGTVSIVLAAGMDVICTFTNVQQTGSITIVKDAQPNDAQDFTFTSSLTGFAPFPLDDDSDATLSSQRVFAGLAPGSYTFTETQVAGWTLSGIVCTPAAGTSTSIGGGSATIVLAPGANITCTYTNVRNPLPGSITIVKDAQPNDAQDFTFTPSIATIPGFQLDDDSDGTLSNQRVISNLPAGSYSFTETQVAGWTLSSIVCTPAGGTTSSTTTGAATIVLAAGDNVTCTFTNVKDSPPGSITIVKDAQPNDAQDFTFTPSIATIPGFQLDDDSDGTLSNQRVISNLPAGSYTFTETQVAGWTLSSIVCTPAGGTTSSTTTGAATIVLAAGDNVTCTFTNVKDSPPGSITIIKDAQPNDAQDFTFTPSIATIPGFQLDDDSDGTLSNQRVISNLPAGSYTFTETQVAGWTLSSIVCTPAGGTTSSTTTGAATIVLAAGDNVTCTFTNVKDSATGTLTIIKDAQPDDPQDFHFVATGSGLADFDLDDDPTDGTLSNTKTFTNLAAGINFTVTETAVTGWTTPSIQCLVAVPGSTTTFTDQANRTFTVNLQAGANVTCTITNVKQTGSITIVKDAQPNDAQDFTFTPGIATIPGFQLDDDSDGTLSNQRVISNLPAGSYTFTETQVAGWTLSSIVCTPAGGTTSSTTTGGATIVLAAGDNVTCTFTNVKDSATGTLTIIKDAQPDDPQDFHFVATGSGLADFDLDDDPTDGTLSNTKTFTNLAAGINFTVTETAVTGWTTPSIQCLVAVPGSTTTFTDQANRTFTVNLQAGADVTCTITNVKQTGSITIVKDAQPNDAQDFTFTPSIATIPGFQLDDDSDGTLSNQRVISNLPAGSYTFTETQVSGWTLSSIVCTPAGGTTSSTTTGAVTIVLAAGDNVTCTFTNVKDSAMGTLTIIKDAQPDDPQDFHFVATGSGLADFDLDDDPTDGTLSNTKTFTNLAAGINFTVTETAVTGWTTPSIQCLVAVPGSTTTFTDQANRTFTVNLQAGADVTCTITNVK